MAIKSEDLHLSIPNASPIFSKLAISSQFKVSLDLVRRSQVGDNLGLFEYLTNCGLFSDTNSTSQKYDFLCSNAVLPGSVFNTKEERGSRQGMIEKFAAMRIYTDFNLTFYIDNDYNVLRMFEEWMNYINPVYDGTRGRYDGNESSQLNAYQDRNTYSRFRYPDDYRRKIQVTKFERDFLQNPNDRNNTFKNMPLLTYHFIDTFPIDLNAVQMTYEGSTFLQVTVTFSYLRHTIEKHGNLQQSVRERLANTNQLTQVNPLRPRVVGKEIAPSTNDPNPTQPVGYLSGGKAYYGPYHENMGVKMVGERHAPYSHDIIYDTYKESLSPDSFIVGDPVTEINPVTEEQTTAGEGTSQTTQTTETSGGGTTTTESTTTTTSTDSSGETTSSTESSSTSSSDGSSSSGSSSYGGYYGY